MSKILSRVVVAFLLLGMSAASASTGLLFNVASSFNMLTIRTVAPGHFYPFAGIKVTSPGYQLQNVGVDCTLLNNGFCQFGVSDSVPKALTFTGAGGGPIQYVLCLNAVGSLSCQRFTSFIRGNFELRQNGNVITSLSLGPDATGSVQVVNTSPIPITGVSVDLTQPVIAANGFSTDCGAVLAGNSSCNINYTVGSSPLATTGTDNITVTGADADNSPQILPVTIQNVQGHIEIQQPMNTPISSLTVGPSTTDTVYVVNTTEVAITNFSVTIPSALTNNGFTTNCTTILAGNSSCSISYSTPTVLSESGTFDITASGTNADNSPQTLSVTLQTLGTAKCWGENSSGQLGDNGASGASSNVPVTVSGMADAIAIAAGEIHTCAIRSNGVPWCWGSNSNGQLGDGNSPTGSDVPVQVNSLTNATAISGGEYHTCAVRNDGTVWCWGDNFYGELGNGNAPTDSDVPVQVEDPTDTTGFLTNVVAVSSGWDYNCALKADNTVWCWGRNNYGQIGDATTGSNRSYPVQVRTNNSLPATFITNAVAVRAGVSSTCALLSDGLVFCWGRNNVGQLGDATNNNRNYAAQVSNTNVNNISSINVGSENTCAVRYDGTTRCWGLGTSGQLGNNATSSSNVPVQVDSSSFNSTINLGGGLFHMCGIQITGEVWCWGENSDGQLGNAANSDEDAPVAVDGSLGIAVALTYNNLGFHSCAITLNP